MLPNLPVISEVRRDDKSCSRLIDEAASWCGPSDGLTKFRENRLNHDCFGVMYIRRCGNGWLGDEEIVCPFFFSSFPSLQHALMTICSKL